MFSDIRDSHTKAQGEGRSRRKLFMENNNGGWGGASVGKPGNEAEDKRQAIS